MNSAEIPEGEKIALAFKGKYFKQTKAINLNGYLFDPIGGNDDRQRFAGTYDGDKKAISGLKVNTGTRGYAALFGAVDTLGVIKNVTLNSPNVTMSGYYYAGGVAAYCMGKVENCQVNNGNISGHLIVGGVCGSAGEATNLTFTGNVTGTSNVGGVIGNTRYPSSMLSATNTTVRVLGGSESYSAGGVVGYLTASSLNGPTPGSLSDSYFSGKVVMVKPGIYAGGISGVSVGAPISRCFSIGEIAHEGNVSQSAIGGIVGAIDNSRITDCFFGGNVEVTSSWVGSIAGYSINTMASDGKINHSEITGCIVTGHSRSTSTQDYAPYLGWFDTRTYGEPPVITSCMVDASLYPRSSAAKGFTQLSVLTSGDAPEGFNAEVWKFEKGFYPSFKTIADNAAMKVARAPMLFEGNDNVENVSTNFKLPTTNSVKWQVSVNGKNGTEGHGLFITGTNPSVGQLNGAIATDTIVATNGNARKWMVVRLAPASMFDGEGTEENPYKISTKADLIRLSEATTNNFLTFDGTHFLITNDIDVAGDQTFLGISNCSSSTYKFGGIIDGGNHTLRGIKLHAATLGDDRKLVDKPTYRAFIGRLKAGAVLKNLRMGDDCEFHVYSNSGVFVAESYGEIENCRNYAPLYAYAGTSGAICGYNRGTVKNCFNAGKVTAGFHYVGGLVGYNYGLLENSRNAGEVTIADLSNNYTTKQYDGVGGLVLANFGKINNCLNTGYVHAEKTVGGLVGWFNTTAVDYMAEASLNLGLIKENTVNFCGEIVGHLYKEKPIRDCYWDSQLSLEKAAQRSDKDGAKGLPTSELTSGKPLAGFNSEYWDYKAGRYPMLKAFLDEPIALAAAEAVVDFGDSENRAAIKNDATLSGAEGMIWKVKNEQNAFTVSGNALELHAYRALSDTLTVTKGRFTKEIPLTATPDSLAAPAIAAEAGTSAGKYKVTFSHDKEGVKYHYTTDGSQPTLESPSTTSSVEITVPEGGAVTVNAIAFHRHYFTSAVASRIVNSTSGIDSIETEEIISRMYFNPQGIGSDRPFEGINIVVTKTADGKIRREKLNF